MNLDAYAVLNSATSVGFNGRRVLARNGTRIDW